ncbi:MAG: ribosome maturation factor RimP [Thermodesulfobacteriota bacterium]|nr:ribosome maturation factor RimP [Thermodesulfobacteriota bacterium]
MHASDGKEIGQTADQKRDTPLFASMDTVISDTWKLIEPVCESEGLELVYVEFQREQIGRVLRLYLDAPGGVTIDDCTRISRQVSALLDVYADSLDNYTLEVSSAGLNRPLYKQNDFQRFAGHTAKIKTAAPVSGRKNFKGELMGVSSGTVEIKVDGDVFSVPYDKIVKAQLIVTDYGVSQ